MKKFLNILVLLILTAMPVFSDTLTYSSVPIKDEKTGNVYDINITIKETKMYNGSKVILI